MKPRAGGLSRCVSATSTEGDLDRQLKAAVALAEPLMLFLIAALVGTIFIGLGLVAATASVSGSTK